ncbi:pilus assembly protein PilP [Lujinxingia vulgaris]|uniref:Pilus assembly protein PilP n=2 Tax=Lujinxingia vulgaris TaxID=2600176 RepID=A0A5C6X5M4_9DELT|nr:pilus assembly protein PilP [Lujinxingia vulgaris]
MSRMIELLNRSRRRATRPSGRRLWIIAALIAISAPSMVACGGDDTASGVPPELLERRKKRAERQKQAEDSPAAEAELQVAAFDPAEEYQRPDYPVRRNPFQPDLDVLQPEPAAVDDSVRPLEPLEEFPLSSLNLVAVISETAVPRAMFVDPNGLGHFVKEGDRIGRNSGVVRVIRDNEVEIREGGADESGAVVTVRLRDQQLRVAESGLTPEEREALQRLLESEEGREAIERSYRDMAPGASATESANESASDTRFPGLAPPSRRQQ